MIRLSRARLAQFIAALAVLISALAMSSGSAQAASINGAFSNILVTASSGSGPIYPWEQVRVTADWSVPDKTPAATTFSLAWPVAQLNGVGGTLALKNKAGDTVATCTLGRASLDCVLTSFVTTHPYNIKGAVWFTLTQVDIAENSTVSIPFTSGTTKTVVTYPTTGSVPNSFNGMDYYKDVWVHDGRVTWYIYLPGGKTGQTEDYSNVVVEDTLGAHQTLSASTFTLEHATKINSQGTWPAWQTAAKSLYTVTPSGTNAFTFTAPLLAKGGWWRLVYDVTVDHGYKGQISNTAKTTWDKHQLLQTTHSEVYLEAGGVGQGEIHAVSVGDTVWWDKNGDGLQNDGAGTGIAGAVLTLTGPDGKPVTDVFGKAVAPITTGATGVYLFQNLPPLPAGDHYTVTVTPPAEYTPTQAGAGTDRAIDSSTGSATSTDLVSNGAQDVTLDFGFVKGAVSVGDYVWFDNNHNGLQDAGEPGIPGVTLTLTGPTGAVVTDLSGNAVQPTTTDAAGAYGFSNLPPLPAGQHYTVTVTTPVGYVATTANAGTNRAVDSSTASAASSDLVTIGDSDLTLDFGFVKPVVSVGDLVWVDTNKNGLQDAGEPGLAGATLTLSGPTGHPVTDTAGNPVEPVTTDATGAYLFSNLPTLPAGQHYTVTVTGPPTYTPTTANVGSDPAVDSSTGSAVSTDLVTSGDKDLTLDFGFTKVAVSVGDYVWWDTNRDGQQTAGEQGVPDVLVTLHNAEGGVVATTRTDADGYYAFAGLTPGQNYSVVFTPPTGAALTTQNAGSLDASDSDPAADGKVTFMAPSHGANLTTPRSADLPTIDAGLVELNLSLTKSVTSSGPYYGGAHVTYRLVPHNDGPVDALVGWSVTDVLPAGSTLLGLSGDGYTCYTNLVCISSTTLAAGEDAAPITAVVQIPDDLTGQFKNVAYVSPASNEDPETNPLVVPAITTDTTASATDNDAEATVDVLPPEPEGIVITLPNTGTTIPLTWFLGAIGIVAAGVILLGASRFNTRGGKG